MKFDTTRFGQIQVRQEDIIIFGDGPLGFPECTRFALIDEKEAAPFKRLQSLDNPALAFVVVDPLNIRPDYHFDITGEDLKLLKADGLEGLQVYAIITMAQDIHDVTINLQGPLVINKHQNVGHQFVLVDSEYSTKEPLMASSDENLQPPASLETDKQPQQKAV
jgi:flagellar assembly factor FliW